MKKILGLLVILFAYACSFGQIPNVDRGKANIQSTDARVKFSLNMAMPVVPDTAHGLNGGNDSLGLQIYVIADTSIYFRGVSAGLSHKWIRLLKLGDAAAGGIASITIGNLTGFATTVVGGTLTSPAFTFTFNNAGAHNFWGNNSGVTGPPGYNTIGVADLPTGIPNANLSNSTIGFTIGSSGSSPGFAASPVALGGTVVLNLPNSSGSSTGILTSTDWNTFNGKQAGIQFQSQGINTGTLGGINLINFTGGGVAAAASGSTLTVTITSGGGGGGGISSLNSLTVATQVFAIGTAGSDFNIVSAGSSHTFNFPNASASNRGLLASADFVTFSNKVNTSDTAAMLAHYIINAGALSPLFTTTAASHNLTFTLSTATLHRFFGTFVSTTPAYGSPSLTGGDFFNQGTATTLLHGNAAGNLTFSAVDLANDITGVLAAINGGTGFGSYTVGDILYANSSTTLAKLIDVSTGNALISGGAGSPPSWGKINLATAVSGILPIVNGGNGTSTPQILGNIGTGIIVTGTWANYTIALDTANLPRDSIFVRNLGSAGDSLAYVIAPRTIAFRKILFTGTTVTHNSDSSLTVPIVNLYNSNGTLTAARTITNAGFNLFYTGTGSFIIGSASSLSQGKLEVTSTTNQLTLAYDATHYSNIATASSGVLGFSPTAFLSVFASAIQPNADNTYNNGAAGARWLTTYTRGINMGVFPISGGGGTIPDNYAYMVYTGSSTGTSTLPAISTTIGEIYWFKNRGSATWTISRAGSDQIYTTSAVSTTTIAPGGNSVMINDGTYWLELPAGTSGGGGGGGNNNIYNVDSTLAGNRTITTGGNLLTLTTTASDLTGMPTPKNWLSQVSISATSGDGVNGIFRTNQTAANTTGTVQGLESYVKVSNATSSVLSSLGLIGNIEMSGAGTLAAAKAFQGGIISNNAGTITQAIAYYDPGMTILGTGVVTDYYGMYLNTSSAGSGTLTNRHGIYQADAAAVNDLFGNLIGHGNTLYGFSGQVNNQSGTSYTLVAGDNGKILIMANASAITLTVPTGLPIGFNCVVVQSGAGQVTFTPSSTAINNRGSFTKTAGQYGVATLFQYNTNTFVSGGDMQ